MGDSEKKALELMAKAEKKLARSKIKGFLMSKFGHGLNNTEAAMECYQRATILFKIEQNWTKVGEAFAKMNELHLNNQHRRKAATNFVEAAKWYKKNGTNKEAIACLERSIELNLEMGDLENAAWNHEAIAVALGTDGDVEGSLHHHEQAVKYFKAEDSNSEADSALMCVAYQAARLENYEKAITIFEELAMSQLQRVNLRPLAKENFKAATCHLCVAVVNCEQALEKYDEKCNGFRDSLDYKLLENLISHVKEGDTNAFDKILKDHDKDFELGYWHMSLFDRVRKTIRPNLAREQA